MTMSDDPITPENPIPTGWRGAVEIEASRVFSRAAEVAMEGPWEGIGGATLAMAHAAVYAQLAQAAATRAVYCQTATLALAVDGLGPR